MKMICLLACLCSVTFAGEVTLADLATASQAAKAQKLKLLSENAARFSRSNVSNYTPAQKAAKLKSMRAEYEALKKSTAFVAPGFELPHKIGAVGAPGRIRIDQIVNGQEMLATMIVPVRVAAGWVNSEHPIWMRKTNTAGKADGNYLDDESAWVVVGTTTYDTAGGGTKTVFVLEPYDTTAINAYMAR